MWYKWCCLLTQNNEADADCQSVSLPEYQESAVNNAADFYVDDALNTMTTRHNIHGHAANWLKYRSSQNICRGCGMLNLMCQFIVMNAPGRVNTELICVQRKPTKMFFIISPTWASQVKFGICELICYRII